MSALTEAEKLRFKLNQIDVELLQAVQWIEMPGPSDPELYERAAKLLEWKSDCLKQIARATIAKGAA